MHIKQEGGVNCTGNKHIVDGTLALTGMEIEKLDPSADVTGDDWRLRLFSTNPPQHHRHLCSAADLMVTKTKQRQQVIKNGFFFVMSLT